MDRFRNGLYRRVSGSYKLKTMTETVRSLRDQQRAGGGASPVTVELSEYHSGVADQKRFAQVGSDVFPALRGAHMLVCK